MHKGNTSRTAPAAPPVASMRLTRGSSAQAVWVVEGRPGAAPLTIGSDARCDWPIRAASVPPQALYVLVDERGVYVHAGLQGQVRMNGRRLGRAWQRVWGEARFDIGLARVEIALDPRSRSRAADSGPAGAPHPAGPSDAETSGVRPSYLPRPISMPQKAMRALRERLSRPSFPEVATVLGKPPRRRARAWRYALAALATAGAYMGWLLLLDG